MVSGVGVRVGVAGIVGGGGRGGVQGCWDIGVLALGSKRWGFYVPFDRQVAKTLAASFSN